MAFPSEDINQRMIQADQAFRQKEYNQAVGILNDIIKTNPNYMPAYRKLGSILILTERPQNALPYLNKAIELAPEDAGNWKVLGYLHKKSKTWTKALKAFQKSLELSEDDMQIWYETILIYRRLGDHVSALNITQKLQQNEPNNRTLLWMYAQILKDMGREEEALLRYDLLLKSEGTDLSVVAIEEWYELMLKHADIKETRHQLKILSQKNPKDTTLMLLHGDSCEKDLDYAEAYQVLQTAYDLDQNNLRINHSLGCLLGRMGEAKASQEYLLRAIASHPLSTDTLRTLGDTHRYQCNDPFFQRLNFAETYLDRMTDRSRMYLHYALGKAYDDIGDLKRAFDHYRVGGELHSQGMAAKSVEELHYITKLFKKNIDKPLIDHYRIQGSQSKKPVFVVGMPRSGTTLIEQVLSSIDHVYGAGELETMNQALKSIIVGKKKINPNGFNPFQKNSEITYSDRTDHYLHTIEAMAAEGSMRIIDKMPTNFMFLGLIYTLFPNASIIHARRHPIEICLSAYRLSFPMGHHWSDDLREMGRYYRLYSELMEHWKSILPEGTILDVRYEDMVADLEDESKRLAAHIDMPWSPACLTFHQSKQPVRTASQSQVRQPIYSTSVNRWHKYEPYLQPLLDEIVDLVEEYESELEIES